jgi:hypothetical protein
MTPAAPPLFSHPLRPTALPHLSAGFGLLALFGLMLGLGRTQQPEVGFSLAGLGLLGAGVCLVAALRSPRLLRLTPDGVELESALGVRRVPWREVRAVIRGEPRRDVELAPYVLQLEGDQEVWLLPTPAHAVALRDWMDEAARRAGLVWVGHRALPPAQARANPPERMPGPADAPAPPPAVPHRRSSDVR